MLRPNGQVCSISPPSNTPGLNLLVHKMLAYDMSVSAYNNNIALYTTFQLLQPLPQLSTRSINLNHRPVRHTIQ